LEQANCAATGNGGADASCWVILKDRLSLGCESCHFSFRSFCLAKEQFLSFDVSAPAPGGNLPSACTADREAFYFQK
jgi:hypothetical protein